MTFGYLPQGVASFTDAWIETEINDINEHVNLSHLLQMRGLKPPELRVDADRNVASFTDAWIETSG